MLIRIGPDMGRHHIGSINLHVTKVRVTDLWILIKFLGYFQTQDLIIYDIIQMFLETDWISA